MAKGISLHVGVNTLNPKHYGGWTGDLLACEADASDMEALAQKQGFTTTLLTSPMALRDTVIQKIKEAAEALKDPEDLFLFTFSGHGGQIPDLTEDEEDALDETLCLYDGQLVDDELNYLWTTFKENVSIIMLSDSCHSGSASRDKNQNQLTKKLKEQGRRARFMPTKQALKTYMDNVSFYADRLNKIPNDHPGPKATILQISGCQDDQLSLEGFLNGVFTESFKTVWNDGNFQGSYADFYKKLLETMKDEEQKPNMLIFGPQQNLSKQKAFSLE